MAFDEGRPSDDDDDDDDDSESSSSGDHESDVDFESIEYPDVTEPSGSPTLFEGDDVDYLLYDNHKSNITLKDYAGFLLWVNELITSEDIPLNARIDDLIVVHFLDLGKKGKRYHDRWPVKVDGKGIPKAKRIPLGYSAKMYVRVGDRDRHGRVARTRH